MQLRNEGAFVTVCTVVGSIGRRRLVYLVRVVTVSDRSVNIMIAPWVVMDGADTARR